MSSASRWQSIAGWLLTVKLRGRPTAPRVTSAKDGHMVVRVVMDAIHITTARVLEHLTAWAGIPFFASRPGKGPLWHARSTARLCRRLLDTIVVGVFM